ncbi:MAG: sugar phosphate isomerase/epimerase family protein [Armatimonadota bacterium]
MRIGGALFDTYDSPRDWASAVQRRGFSAAFCPVGEDESDESIREWVEAAAEAHIVIAEVGAWGNNPVSPDGEVRRAGIEGCCARLDLADRIGATCCVNVSGSRGERWAGPHEDNLTADTFALIVDSVREIIDTVEPTRTFYALETMPWLYPDSARSYLDLLQAIDRPRFAVHLDPVNLVNCPERYYHSGAMIEECFTLLGPHIKSCHAKDIVLEDELTLHMGECRPGAGNLDWRTYVRELGRLDEDIPLMIEHLSDPSEVRAAAAHIRNIAQVESVTVV